MSNLKPVTLWGHYAGPNPLKVHIVMEELGVPIDWKLLSFDEMKLEPYNILNPNGRVPAIEDPNTGLKLWESGPIIEYLVEQYDKEHQLTYDDLQMKWEVKQWIAYQISGQGPYYGQMIWLGLIHPEVVPSVIDRYVKEVERVRGVLNTHLTKQAQTNQTNTPWLVGTKVTAADLAWVMWESIATFAYPLLGKKFQGEYPAYDEWIGRLMSRPACKKALQMRADGLKAQSVPVRADVQKKVDSEILNGGDKS